MNILKTCIVRLTYENLQKKGTLESLQNIYTQHALVNIPKLNSAYLSLESFVFSFSLSGFIVALVPKKVFWTPFNYYIEI